MKAEQPKKIELYNRNILYKILAGEVGGGEAGLSAGTEEVRHYQSPLLTPAVGSVQGGGDLDGTPQTGGAQDVGGRQAGLSLQQGVEAEDAVGRSLYADSLYVVDGHREGERAGSLGFD